MANTWTQGLVFGVPYTLTLVGFLWAVCRYLPSSRERLLWLAIMMGAILPDLLQISFELHQVSLLAGVLFIVVGRMASPVRMAIATGVSFLLFLFHPAASVALALAAAIAFRFSGPGKMVRFGLASALLVLSVVRALQPLDAYERSEATWAIFRQHFLSAVWGAPLIMGAVALTAAWACFGGRLRSALPWLALAYAAVGLYWVSDPSRWRESLDYRNMPFAAIPLLAACALCRRPQMDEEGGEAFYERGLMAFACAFGLVLSAQAFSWNTLRRVLQDQLRSIPGVHRYSEPSFHWIADTPLGNWTLPHQCLMLQGGKVSSLVFVEGDPGESRSFVLSHQATLDLSRDQTRGIWDFSLVSKRADNLRVAYERGFFDEERFENRSLRWASSRASLVIDGERGAGAHLKLKLFSAFSRQKLAIVAKATDGGTVTRGEVDLGGSHFGSPVVADVALPDHEGTCRIEITGTDPGGRFANDPRTISWGLELPVEPR